MKRHSSALTVLLGWLVVFLPLSAWLVSAFGSPWLSFGRDLILLLLILLAAVNGRQKPDWLLGLIAIFVFYGLANFFWREESFAQWWRGARYVLEPLVLFGAIRRLPLDLNRPAIFRIYGYSLFFIVLIGLLEILAPAIVHLRFFDAGRGYLATNHLASNFTRLQSLLAGPNALGLYLMGAVVLAPLWLGTLPKKLGYFTLVGAALVLLLTFSRSSYLGLIMALSVWFLAAKPWRRHLGYAGTAVAVVALGLTLAVYYQSVIVRPTSDQPRTEQYRRVWLEAPQIGLLGKGIGSAGPVSQDRLDGGPNRFTENSYLDIFEALGWIGLGLYLAIWIATLGRLATSGARARPVFLSGLALATAGIFINHYTGQAAIWLFWLLAALAMSPRNVPEPSDG